MFEAECRASEEFLGRSSEACYVINRSPRAALDGKVAEEVWTGNDVDYSGLRVFGFPAYVHVSSDLRSKLDPKSRKCIFVGYVKDVKGSFGIQKQRKW